MCPALYLLIGSMDKYLHYQINDFIQDESFIDWCLSDNSNDSMVWDELYNSRIFRTKLSKARQIVLAIHEAESTPKKPSSDDELWKRIDTQLFQKSTSSYKANMKWLAAIAASLFIFGILSYQLFDSSDMSLTTEKLSNQEWINVENADGISLEINLPDKSLVILEPFSSLKYPSFFTPEQRTVFLKGEAFFDIERDTLRPFLVYANETITKVLGTSFTIKAYEGQETVEVDVKSGRVAVYAKVASKKGTKEKNIVLQTDEEIIVPLPNKKLEVNPNHRVIFDRKIELLTKKITKTPIFINKVESLAQYSFKDESVIKLFNAISLVYGVDLEFDEELLADCLITTKLEDEPLFQVLEIVCAALNLNFQEVDATISITGKGCHQ